MASQKIHPKNKYPYPLPYLSQNLGVHRFLVDLSHHVKALLHLDWAFTLLLVPSKKQRLSMRASMMLSIISIDWNMLATSTSSSKSLASPSRSCEYLPKLLSSLCHLWDLMSLCKGGKNLLPLDLVVGMNLQSPSQQFLQRKNLLWYGLTHKQWWLYHT